MAEISQKRMVRKGNTSSGRLGTPGQLIREEHTLLHGTGHESYKTKTTLQNDLKKTNVRHHFCPRYN